MFRGFFQRFRRRSLPSGAEPVAELPPAAPVIELAPPPIITPPPEGTLLPDAAVELSVEDRALEVPGPPPPELKEPEPVLLLPPPSLPEPVPEPPTIVVSGDRASYFAPVRRPAVQAPVHRLIAPDLAMRAWQSRAPKPASKPQLPSVPDPPAIDVIAATVEPLSLFATGYGNPSSPAGAVRSIDPGLFTSFIANREGSADVPPQATQEYLADPALLNQALELRRRVLDRIDNGEPPLSQTAFYQLAYALAGHPSTALLLCHNVAKSFARGGRLIHWQLTNRVRAEFSDGEHTYSGRNFFFALFAAAPDPGDWYRFFAHAALASFTIRGETRFPAPLPQAAAADLARRHDKLAEQFPDKADSSRSKAALWSNTFSFWEAGCFCRTLERSTELIGLSRDGCRFANRINGMDAKAQHSWRVPKPGGLEPGWNLDQATVSQLMADG
jgi:hypothetical protein